MARAHGLEIVGLSLVFGNPSMSRASRNANAESVVFGWNYPIFEGIVFFFQRGGTLHSFCRSGGAEAIARDHSIQPEYHVQ
ncbi:MAG: hypothetical protein OXF88_20460 [Rhodobacteraceae bacterium]|nr:hypothetical protein [Paracoccaceae bacterium]MCY4141962.1 hypothetical protein [Paracoccaceae bacterium]